MSTVASSLSPRIIDLSKTRSPPHLHVWRAVLQEEVYLVGLDSRAVRCPFVTTISLPWKIKRAAQHGLYSSKKPGLGADEPVRAKDGINGRSSIHQLAFIQEKVERLPRFKNVDVCRVNTIHMAFSLFLAR